MSQQHASQAGMHAIGSSQWESERGQRGVFLTSLSIHSANAPFRMQRLAHVRLHDPNRNVPNEVRYSGLSGPRRLHANE